MWTRDNHSSLQISGILLSCLLILAYPAKVSADTPTVDGRYTGDELNYQWVGNSVDYGADIYTKLTDHTLYVLVRVRPTFNDNVFGDHKLDETYLKAVNWNNHNFKMLVQSDHIALSLQCGDHTFLWKQDYLYEDNGIWRSDTYGPDGDASNVPVILQSASSMQWNLNHTLWDITLDSTRTSDMDFKSPDPKNNYPNFDNTNLWEWAMVYEMSIDVSNCPGQNFVIQVPESHNSPAKEMAMIDIEKATNGDDADFPSGPVVMAGSTVSWTYVVINLGSVPISVVTVTDDNGTPAHSADDFHPTFTGGDVNSNGLLELGEFWRYQATGTALVGQYGNVAKTLGFDEEQNQLMDSDPSHYFGYKACLDIEKATNGDDADEPKGPIVHEGSTITWTYVVKNLGNVPISKVRVMDDNGSPDYTDDDFYPAYLSGDNNPADGLLDPSETWTYRATGTAQMGQYENWSKVTGRDPFDNFIRDRDPSHYFGNCVCDPLPEADFTANVTKGIRKLCVQFTNLSQHAGSYLWEFGDGTTSTEEHPYHCFYNPPTKHYDVKLTAFCACHPDTFDTMLKQSFIVVNREVLANFSAYPIVGPPKLSVKFNNESEGNANRFFWDYGDGTTELFKSDIRYAPDPTHVYTVQGGYHVTLRAWGNGGADTLMIRKLIYVDSFYVALEFVSGSPALPGEGWGRIINHDVIPPDESMQAANNGNAWAIFRFPDSKAYLIHKIRLLANNGTGSRFLNHLVKDFEIHVSADGINFTPAFNGTSVQNYLWEINKFDPVEATYIKLVLCNARGASSPYVTLCEFQVFAKPKEESMKQIHPVLLSHESSIDGLPTDYALHQNYPNPFNPETNIGFQLPEAADVVLNIYNINGQLISTLVDSRQPAGYHHVVFKSVDDTGTPVGSGIYFYSIQATNDQSQVFSIIRKMTMIK